MGRKQGRPQAGKEVLTREQILITALRLVDTKGMNALSMRRLAEQLGVDPMAIYYHISNKRALIAGMVELVFTELEVLPSTEATWQARVRAVARAYYNIAQAHPHLILHLATHREPAAVAVLEANETLYEALVESGLSPHMVIRAADLIVDYVNGGVLAQIAGPLGQPEERRDLLIQLDDHPSERFPVLRRVLGRLPAAALQADFEAGLEIILAGIESLSETYKPTS